MKLLNHKSDIVRRLILNCLIEASVRETDLAAEVQPWMSPATLYRLLGTDQILTLQQADVLLHGLMRFEGFDPQKVWAALECPLQLDLLPITELAACQCLRLDSDDLTKVSEFLETTMATAKKLWTFGHTFPLFLFDEELANLLLTERVTRFASDPEEALPRLKEEIQRHRESFMNGGGLGGVSDISVIVTLSGLVRFARGTLPYRHKWQEETEVSLESIIHDAIVERNVSLSVLDDLNDGPARHWAWKHSGFASMTLFEPGILLKRKRGTLAVRLVDARNSDIAQALADAHYNEFRIAKALSCHGPEADEVANFVQSFVRFARTGKPLRTWKPGAT